MNKVFSSTIGLCFVLATAGCDNRLDEVSATIESQSGANGGNVCSIVSINNHLRTNHKKSPDEARQKVNVLKYTYQYEVLATAGAAPQYQLIRLGDKSETVQDRERERYCARYSRTDNTRCVDYEYRYVYRSVIDYGASRNVSVIFNNLFESEVNVPSEFSFALTGMSIGPTTWGKRYTGLDFIVPSKLPCYYTHLITLYNSNLAPEGALDSGRAKTTEAQDAFAVNVASFALLTKAELDQLKSANGHLPTIRDMQTRYNKRAADLAKYLSVSAKGKDAVAYIATAIENGNWNAAYSMARKQASGNTMVSADEVLAVLPDASSVIGAELAQGFAKAVAETLTLQGSIDL